MSFLPGGKFTNPSTLPDVSDWFPKFSMATDGGMTGEVLER